MEAEMISGGSISFQPFDYEPLQGDILIPDDLYLYNAGGNMYTSKEGQVMRIGVLQIVYTIESSIGCQPFKVLSQNRLK